MGALSPLPLRCHSRNHHVPAHSAAAGALCCPLAVLIYGQPHHVAVVTNGLHSVQHRHCFGDVTQRGATGVDPVGNGVFLMAHRISRDAFPNAAPLKRSDDKLTDAVEALLASSFRPVLPVTRFWHLSPCLGQVAARRFNEVVTRLRR